MFEDLKELDDEEILFLIGIAKTDLKESGWAKRLLYEYFQSDIEQYSSFYHNKHAFLPICRDDWRQVVSTALLKAIDRYKKTRASFRTYFITTIRGEVSNLVRKQLRQKRKGNLNTKPLPEDIELPETFTSQATVAEFLQHLSPTEKTMLHSLVEGQQPDEPNDTLTHLRSKATLYLREGTTSCQSKITMSYDMISFNHQILAMIDCFNG